MPSAPHIEQMLSNIEALINAGRYFEAHNLAEECCALDPDNLRAKQLCGLSMSKSGARKAAIAFLEPVLQTHSNDPETAGILGGVYKEQFKMTAETVYARKSLETYWSNFTITKSYYTGINAATMSQILGQGKQARAIAGEVVAIAANEQSFWAYATLGEAYLLLRQSQEAEKNYVQALKLAEGEHGKLGSVYAQLMVLQHYIHVPEKVMQMFKPPNIAVFAGHMIDHNREIPRFPQEISEDIKFAIANELKIKNIKVGYSSLACGSDILFVEALLALGGEANILLPFNRDDFIRTSVAFAGKDWLERFKQIEATTKITYISHEKYDDADMLFAFLGKVLVGAGIMRAALYYDKPYLLTVASELDAARKVGGTNAIRQMWPFNSNHININPDNFILQLAAGNAARATPALTNEARPATKQILYFILATLINNNSPDADMAGVTDKIAAEFIEFPGRKRSGISEEGVYALYARAHNAMDFSLRLLDWARTANIEVRIALEAILMKPGSSPLKLITETSNLKSLAFTDACYATMQFAAALSAEQPGRYDFHHVGTISPGNTDEGQEIYRIDYKVKTALS